MRTETLGTVQTARANVASSRANADRHAVQTIQRPLAIAVVRQQLCAHVTRVTPAVLMCTKLNQTQPASENETAFVQAHATPCQVVHCPAPVAAAAAAAVAQPERFSFGKALSNHPYISCTGGRHDASDANQLILLSVCGSLVRSYSQRSERVLADGWLSHGGRLSQLVLAS